MVHTIRKYLTYLAILGAVLVGCAWLIASIFEEEVNHKVLSAVNGQLKVPIEASEMDLSIFHRFPNPSVHLEGVYIKEALPDRVFVDTLLYAEHIFLEMDLLDMFYGNISISEVAAKNVLLNPSITEDGTHNFEIWRSDTTRSDNVIALEMIELVDLRFTYSDRSSDVYLSARSQELLLTGLLDGQGTNLGFEGDVFFDSLLVGQNKYVHELETKLDLSLNLPDDGAVLVIKKGRFETEDLALQADVLWTGEGEGEHLAVLLSGKDVDLEGAAALIPELGSYLTEHYGIKGKSDIDLTYAGFLNKGAGPSLRIELDVLNGQMKERTTGVLFENISMKGSMTLNGHGKLQDLSIDRVNARAGNGTFGGDLRYMSGRESVVDGSVKSSIDLADLFQFIRVDEKVTGSMALTVDFNGTLDLSDGLQPSDLRSLTISGRSDLKNASFQLKGMRHPIRDLNATLIAKGPNAVVPSMTATILDDRIELNGDLEGLLSYLLFDDERLLVDAKVRTAHLDLEQILLTTDDNESSHAERDLSLPADIDMRLKLSVGELNYATFTAVAIQSQVNITNGRLVASPLSFQSSGGTISGSLELNTNVDGTFPLRVDAALQGIDVRELFVEFDNFGQDFIRHDHLKGTLSSTVTLNASLSRDMRLTEESINSTIVLQISDGELIKHEPMMDIADFVRDNKLYAAFIRADELESRLTHIRFDDLSNTIHIKNSEVHIPYMEVKSSAMSVNIAGVHTFDDRMDHHVNFRLAELLTRPQEDAEFGEVIDDGTGMRIFLHMYGPSDALRIENDKVALAEHRRSKLNQEKETLKEILKDPFQRTDDQADSSHDGPKFEVDWDGKEDEQPRPKKKGLGGLFKKIVKDDDKDVSFQIDD